MSQSPIRLLLLMIGASAAGAIAVSVLVPSRWTPPEPQLPDMSVVSLTASADGEARQVDLDEVASRPLFIAGRRPQVAPVAEEAPEAEPDPDPFPEADLVGIFGSGRKAGVIVSQDGKAARVRVGAQWSGWVLRAVDVRKSTATFGAQDRQDHVLELKRQPQQGAIVFSADDAPDAARRNGETDEVRPEGEQREAETEAESAHERRNGRRARTPTIQAR